MNLVQLGWRALTSDKLYMRGLVADLGSMSRLHVELFMAEARAESARIKRKMLLLIAALGLVAMAVVFLLIAIIAMAWDTPYRMHALFGVPLILAIAGGISYFCATAQTTKSAPFAQTTAELKKDADWVMELL